MGEKSTPEATLLITIDKRHVIITALGPNITFKRVDEDITHTRTYASFPEALMAIAGYLVRESICLAGEQADQ